MENYQDAFLHRLHDTQVLHESDRKIAAIHFGGITIECLLKSIVLTNIPPGATPEWSTSSNDPGHTISNPGHSFVEALKRHEKLYYRAQKFKPVMKWINDVECPSEHFIDMRYACSDPEDAIYRHWFKTYKSLLGWIQKQSSQL